MIRHKSISCLLAVLLQLSFQAAFAQKDQTKSSDIKNQGGKKTLLVFFDGLRPDYITPELMPNLYAFKQSGVFGSRHHSVFPTVTRLNASAYATGSYPHKSGILGNKVYFPEVDKLKGLNTGDAKELLRIDSATKGKLLTAASFGELMQAAGKRFMVFSSGSTGQALLQNHTLSAGAIVNPDMIRPESYKETVYKVVGRLTDKEYTAKHVWAVDALLKLGLQADGPDVSAIWVSDPDHTTHEDGIGVPSHIAALKLVDGQFGRILEHLKSSKLDQVFDVIVSADHGFITHEGKKTITAYLLEKGLKASKSSDDVIVSDGAIYVKDKNPKLIKKIVVSLQASDFAGAIFTKGKNKGDMKGWVEGTLSFESIHWDHPTRAADILVTEHWDDRRNANGYPGISQASGPAGHGGISRYEISIALMANGPSFKKSTVSDLPTSNIDLVPTILYLHQVPVPGTMDGRVIYEILNTAAPATAPVKATTEVLESSTKGTWGEYKVKLQRTVLGKYVYVDQGSVERK